MSDHDEELRKHDERMKEIRAAGEKAQVHTSAVVLVLTAEVQVLKELLLEVIDSLPAEMLPSFQDKPSFSQLRKERIDELLLHWEKLNPGLAAAVSEVADTLPSDEPSAEASDE